MKLLLLLLLRKLEVELQQKGGRPWSPHTPPPHPRVCQDVHHSAPISVRRTFPWLKQKGIQCGRKGCLIHRLQGPSAGSSGAQRRTSDPPHNPTTPSAEEDASLPPALSPAGPEDPVRRRSLSLPCHGPHSARRLGLLL